MSESNRIDGQEKFVKRLGEYISLHRLPGSRTFHQAKLDLVEPASPVLVSQVIVRLPVRFGLLNLPEEICLVDGIVPDQDPSPGLIVHLPGPGRDRLGRGGD